MAEDYNELEVLEQHVARLVESHKNLQNENAALRTRLLEALNQQQVIQGKNTEAVERINKIVNRLQVAVRSTN